jgi:hypothetical protein
MNFQQPETGTGFEIALLLLVSLSFPLLFCHDRRT